MSTRPRSLVLGLIAVALVAGGVWWAQPKAEAQLGAAVPGDVQLRNFMRKKLAASEKILEGLVTEDAAILAEGAKILSELSAAEKWRVTNDVMYRQFSDEFQRIAKKLGEAAEKKNFDDAAVRWLDCTMSCIECHRFVKGIRIAAK